jgi:hypothetical protein
VRAPGLLSVVWCFVPLCRPLGLVISFVLRYIVINIGYTIILLFIVLCVKIDLSIHKEMHSVLTLKLSVTPPQLTVAWTPPPRAVTPPSPSHPLSAPHASVRTRPIWLTIGGSAAILLVCWRQSYPFGGQRKAARWATRAGTRVEPWGSVILIERTRSEYWRNIRFQVPLGSTGLD